MPDVLQVALDQGIATVTMQRAGNNAIAADLARALEEAFRSLAGDPAARVIVLTSAFPGFFSVGADLGAMAAIDRAAPDAEDQMVAAFQDTARGFDAVASCPKPVIAAINGHALGGGCELTLCCDYRIMIDDGRARIGLPEAGLGIIPGAGGTQRLTRLVGLAKALPLLYEGTRLTAAEAQAIGLVHSAPSAGDFEGVVGALASRLATAATRALGLIKDAVQRGAEVPLEQALSIEARNAAKVMTTEDAQAGLAAFLAKHAAVFNGR